MRRNRKTTIKLLRPDQVWHPPIGAPRGNRNAGKPLSTIAAKIKDLRRRAKAACAAAINKKGGASLAPPQLGENY